MPKKYWSVFWNKSMLGDAYMSTYYELNYIYSLQSVYRSKRTQPMQCMPFMLRKLHIWEECAKNKFVPRVNAKRTTRRSIENSLYHFLTGFGGKKWTRNKTHAKCTFLLLVRKMLPLSDCVNTEIELFDKVNNCLICDWFTNLFQIIKTLLGTFFSSNIAKS